MAPLPTERVTPSPPFTHVGIDFLGPLYIKNAFQEAEKSYVCLFTCCATRAVHLELTRSMTTESFLLNVCLTILNRIKQRAPPKLESYLKRYHAEKGPG